MTTSNLAILIFVTTIVLFGLSLASRNPARQSPRLDQIKRILSVVVIGLAAMYFYQRFVGGA